MSIKNKEENWNQSKIKHQGRGEERREEEKRTQTFAEHLPLFFSNGLVAGEYYFKLKGTEKAKKGKLCVLVEPNINWSADAKKGKISKFPTVWYHSSSWCKIHVLLAECCDVAVSLTDVATAVLQGCGTRWLRLGHGAGRSSPLPGHEDGKAQQSRDWLEQAGGKNK